MGRAFTGAEHKGAGPPAAPMLRPQMIVFRKYTFTLVGLVQFIWVPFLSHIFTLVTLVWSLHFGLVASALHLGHTIQMPEMPFGSRAAAK